MSNLDLVNQLYKQVLFREPDLGGSYYWASVMDSGISVAQVTNHFLDCREVQQTISPIIKLYQAAFGRLPDAQGLEHWVNQYRSAGSTPAALTDIAQSFVHSTEFIEKYGDQSSPSAAYIGQLYQSAFGRTPNQAELNYWENSGKSAAQLVSAFAQSTEMNEIARGAVKIILAYHGILNVIPTQAQIASALVTQDDFVTINNLYASEGYAGVHVPGVTTHTYQEVVNGSGSSGSGSNNSGGGSSGGNAVPLTFIVSNDSFILDFDGTAAGDITFTVASDGTASFTREGVLASSSFALSSFSAINPPNTILLAADISDISIANAISLEMTGSNGEIDFNGHGYNILDSIDNADGLDFTDPGHLRGLNLTGSMGDQYVTGSPYGDVIVGGDGYDYILGGEGNDSLAGGSDDDTLVGGGGLNYLEGGDGNDVFVYDAGAYITPANDAIDGGDGMDMIWAWAGAGAPVGANLVDADFANAVNLDAITLSSSSYGARLTLGANANIAFAEGIFITLEIDLPASSTSIDGTLYTHNMAVMGSDQSDAIFGGSGADFIDAGLGADLIAPGAGADWMIGGVNYDSFAVGYAGSSVMATNTEDQKFGAVTIGEEIIFDNGVDIISDFASGDLIVTPGAPLGVPTSLLGVEWRDAPLNAGQTYLVYGTYDDAAKAFTVVGNLYHSINANDALMVSGDSLEWLHSSTGFVVLENLTTGLTPSDFMSARIGTPRNDYLGASIGHVDSARDYLIGLEGDDFIFGGLGADILEGGQGFDTFLYTGSQEDCMAQMGDVVSGEIDVINAFDSGVDQIALERLPTNADDMYKDVNASNASYSDALISANHIFNLANIYYLIEAYGSGSNWTAVLFSRNDITSASSTAGGAIQIGSENAYSSQEEALGAITFADIVAQPVG